MPVAVLLEFANATLEEYDQVVEKMGFTPGGPGAPGGLFHWVTATDGEVGVAEEPTITFHELHNHLTAR
jgi:hypothetical protein